MEKGDITFLKQLIKSLEDSEPKLEKAYEKESVESFNKIKSFMLNMQKQIEDILQ